MSSITTSLYSNRSIVFNSNTSPYPISVCTITPSNGFAFAFRFRYSSSLQLNATVFFLGQNNSINTTGIFLTNLTNITNYFQFQYTSTNTFTFYYPTNLINQNAFNTIPLVINLNPDQIYNIAISYIVSSKTIQTYVDSILYSSLQLIPNLIAYYDFSVTTSGTTVQDLSGSGYNLTWVSTPYTYTYNATGQSYATIGNASASIVQAVSQALPGLSLVASGGTVEVLVNIVGANGYTNNNVNGIFSFTGTTYSFILTYLTSIPNIHIWLANVGWLDTGIVLTFGTWYHVVFTITPAGLLTLYVNGSSVYTRTGAAFGASGIANALQLGQNQDYDPPNNKISFAKLYNVPLTAAQIQENYYNIYSKFQTNPYSLPAPTTYIPTSIAYLPTRITSTYNYNFLGGNPQSDGTFTGIVPFVGNIYSFAIYPRSLNTQDVIQCFSTDLSLTQTSIASTSQTPISTPKLSITYQLSNPQYNNANSSNLPTFDPISESVIFRGNQYLQYSENLNFSSGFTIFIKFQFTSFHIINNETLMTILQNNQVPLASLPVPNSIVIQRYGITNNLFITFVLPNGISSSSIITNTSFQKGTTYTITVTFDGVNLIAIYVNGNLDTLSSLLI